MKHSAKETLSLKAFGLAYYSSALVIIHPRDYVNIHSFIISILICIDEDGMTTIYRQYHRKRDICEPHRIIDQPAITAHSDPNQTDVKIFKNYHISREKFLDIWMGNIVELRPSCWNFMFVRQSKVFGLASFFKSTAL